MMPPKRRTRKHAAKGRGRGCIQEAARSPSPSLLASSDDERENEALVATVEPSLSEELLTSRKRPKCWNGLRNTPAS